MPKTQPEPIRDQKSDHLLTPENSVIALIDFQPSQYSTVGSASKERINLNVATLAKAATKWNVPIIVSTVGVDLGVNEPTIPEIMDELPDVTEIDRSGVNAWEDEDFRNAIRATGRRKVVMAGLWTELCLTLPTLDMLREGFEVYPVIDAVGGVSQVSHEMAIHRMIQAGATPVTALGYASELMRNWARPDSHNLREIMNWYFPIKHQLDAEGK